MTWKCAARIGKHCLQVKDLRNERIKLLSRLGETDTQVCHNFICYSYAHSMRVHQCWELEELVVSMGGTTANTRSRRTTQSASRRFHAEFSGTLFMTFKSHPVRDLPDLPGDLDEIAEVIIEKPVSDSLICPLLTISGHQTKSIFSKRNAVRQRLLQSL